MDASDFRVKERNIYISNKKNENYSLNNVYFEYFAYKLMLAIVFIWRILIGWKIRRKIFLILKNPRDLKKIWNWNRDK